MRALYIAAAIISLIIISLLVVTCHGGSSDEENKPDGGDTELDDDDSENDDDDNDNSDETRQACWASSDCPKGYYCNYEYFCEKLEEENQPASCESDEDCCEAEFCNDEKKCVTKRTKDMQCHREGECIGELSCQFTWDSNELKGFCMEITEMATKKQGEACTSWKECINDYCFWSTFTCVAPCEKDEHCPDGTKCRPIEVDENYLVNACLPECKNNSDCSGDMKCVDGNCDGEGEVEFGGACINYNDCESASACYEGFPEGFCTNYCESNYDCPYGFECIAFEYASICMKKCSDNDDCREGYYCIKWSDVDVPVCTWKCQSDLNCKENYYCNQELGQCRGSSCERPSDCPAGFICTVYGTDYNGDGYTDELDQVCDEPIIENGKNAGEDCERWDECLSEWCPGEAAQCTYPCVDDNDCEEGLFCKEFVVWSGQRMKGCLRQ